MAFQTGTELTSTATITPGHVLAVLVGLGLCLLAWRAWSKSGPVITWISSGRPLPMFTIAAVIMAGSLACLSDCLSGGKSVPYVPDMTNETPPARVEMLKQKYAIQLAEYSQATPTGPFLPRPVGFGIGLTGIIFAIMIAVTGAIRIDDSNYSPSRY